jgi:hypothetical protein
MRNLLFDLWMRLRTGFAGVRIFIPIALIAVLLAGYTWWWQQVADSVRVSAGAFQLDQHALGRETLWDSVDVSGFPYRVEAQFKRPRITAPDRGIAWDGKSVVLSIQPLKPHHIALNFVGQQHVLYVKDGRLIDANVDASKALVNIVAGSNGAESMRLDVEGLSGQGEVNDKHIELVVQNAGASLDVEESDPDATTAPIAVTASLKNIALRGDLSLPFGPTIALVDLKAHLRYPSLAPEDGSIPSPLAAWRATNTPIEIDSFNLDWGGVTLEARGDLKLDAQTRPEGRLHLKIGNHRRLVEVLIAEGWISAEAQPNIDGALNTLAFMSGDPERRIDVTVRFNGGSAYLELFGLVPIRLGPVSPLFPPPTIAMPG